MKERSVSIREFVLAGLLPGFMISCGGSQPGSSPEKEMIEPAGEPAPNTVTALKCGYDIAEAQVQDKSEFLNRISGLWVSSLPGYAVIEDAQTRRRTYSKSGLIFDDYHDQIGRITLYYNVPREDLKLKPDSKGQGEFDFFAHRIGKEVSEGPYAGYRILQLERNEKCQTFAIRYNREFDFIEVIGFKTRLATERGQEAEFFAELQGFGHRYDRISR